MDLLGGGVEDVHVTADGLTAGEVEVLIDGLGDDVALDWVLIRLGLAPNPPDPGPPSADVLDAAFRSMGRLVDRGLAAVGRIEPTGSDSGGRPRVRHVAEPLDVVRRRVEEARPDEWQWECWLVGTDRGDATARAVLAHRGGVARGTA